MPAVTRKAPKRKSTTKPARTGPSRKSPEAHLLVLTRSIGGLGFVNGYVKLTDDHVTVLHRASIEAKLLEAYWDRGWVQAAIPEKRATVEKYVRRMAQRGRVLPPRPNAAHRAEVTQ